MKKKRFKIYYTSIKGKGSRKKSHIVCADNIDDAKIKTMREVEDLINIRRGCYEIRF
ncbi:hypothetical protein OAD25_01575 [Gammaproteobacteria bacterium]|nr:hypothetical protein [Gammaproteobacteria bacterium]